MTSGLLMTNIPESMKREKRWVGVVLFQGKKGGTSKVPVNCNGTATGHEISGASVSDPATWSTFEDAWRSLNKSAFVNKRNGVVTHIGFVLGGGWAGVDLDGGEDHGGQDIDEETKSAFMALDTYTEVSLSGCGYHVIGKYHGEKLSPNRHKNIEIYTEGRYFLITGDAITTRVCDITDPLKTLHEKYIARPIAEKSVFTDVRAESRFSREEKNMFLRENIQDLLEHIPADCDRETWIKVGTALKTEGFDFTLFDSWSKRSINKYDAADTKSAWRSLKEGVVSGGYLVRLAKNNGWQYAHQSQSDVSFALEIDNIPHNAVQWASGNSVFNEWKRMYESGALKAVSTGFSALDKTLGGGFLSGLVVVSGAPSEGKSALVMQIAEHIANQQKKNLLVFNFEMSSMQLMARSLSRISYECSTPETVQNAFTAQEVMTLNGNSVDGRKACFDLACKKYVEISGRQFFSSRPSPTIEEMIQECERFIDQTGSVPIVVVDYLQLLNVRNNMADGMKDVTLALKRFAIEYDTIVIAVSSVNRVSQSSGLSMGSSYGSGFIEYSADYLFTLEFTASYVAKQMGENAVKCFRSSVETLKANPFRRMTLTVQKSRYTETGRAIGFLFGAPYSHFKEIDKETQERSLQVYRDVLSKGVIINDDVIFQQSTAIRLGNERRMR